MVGVSVVGKFHHSELSVLNKGKIMNERKEKDRGGTASKHLP